MAGIGWLTYADFADLVGDRFEVRPAEGESLPLVLAEATESTQPGGPDLDGRQRQQFSLVFRGPVDRPLPQGNHELVHDTLGDLVLFLVPLGPDGTGLRYEAAFA